MLVARGGHSATSTDNISWSGAHVGSVAESTTGIADIRLPSVEGALDYAGTTHDVIWDSKSFEEDNDCGRVLDSPHFENSGIPRLNKKSSELFVVNFHIDVSDDALACVVGRSNVRANLVSCVINGDGL